MRALSMKEAPESPGGSKSKPGGISLSPEPLVHSTSATESELRDLPVAEHGIDPSELPAHYGTHSLFLTARDPHCLYAYWDWDWREFRQLSLPGARPVLRLSSSTGQLLEVIPLNLEAHNWYIHVSEGNCSYLVEIGVQSQDQWTLIAQSNPAHTPADQLGVEEGFEIASVPFHLHFDELLETLRSALDSGESLAGALGRLQQAGLPVDASGNFLPDMTSEQRALLELLLGPEVWTQLQSGSADLAELFRAQIAQATSSGGGSEALVRLRLASLLGGGASSLFNGAWGSAVQGLSSETLASWQNALSSSGWAQAVASGSWLAAIGFESGGFNAAGASELLAGAASSGLSGLASAPSGSHQLSSHSLSSYQSTLMSWSSAPGPLVSASWFAAGAGMSEIFSSWQLGSTSASWGGASWSSALSSWSGRSFFMHVNAEVIFYGGTDPQAKVWIAGQPINLDSDGNFRYHFKFPNADLDIPIVAESPDGIETRAATLRFHRSTGKVGVVTDTPQPAHLSDPMGRVG